MGTVYTEVLCVFSGGNPFSKGLSLNNSRKYFYIGSTIKTPLFLYLSECFGKR